MMMIDSGSLFWATMYIPGFSQPTKGTVLYGWRN